MALARIFALKTSVATTKVSAEKDTLYAATTPSSLRARDGARYVHGACGACARAQHALTRGVP